MYRSVHLCNSFILRWNSEIPKKFSSVSGDISNLRRESFSFLTRAATLLNISFDDEEEISQALPKLKIAEKIFADDLNNDVNEVWRHVSPRQRHEGIM